MINTPLTPAKKLKDLYNLVLNYILIRTSSLFDKDWYLENNPDVVQAKVNPYIHFLRHGGIEGRDPGSDFSSSRYLDTYADVKAAGLNPLVHYLRYGKTEGRMIQPKLMESIDLRYECPVCQKPVRDFLPLSPHLVENLHKHGFRYKPEEGETINFEQYACPNCYANDRDRLTASFLREMLPLYTDKDPARLLDIAPSLPLSQIFEAYHVNRHTADLFTEGADLRVDITNMPEVASDAYDILICSHVLEHVNDDKKALAELYRIIKPGGWGVIMVPIILTLDQIDEDPQVTDEAERWRRFGQFDHVRLYNKSGFVERMEAAGFHVRQLGISYFGKELFKKYGLTDTSVLYIAEKVEKGKPFLLKILNLVRENSYYEFSDAEDFFVAPNPNREIKLVQSLMDRKKIQDSAFEKLNREYDLEGLNFTYNLLSDEYSKEMLLRVVAGRVMGPSRCRFPLYYSHIWKYFEKIDELKLSDECTKSGMWEFYLYDLERLGHNVKLHTSKMILFIDFVLEQYKYQDKVSVRDGDYVIDGGACFGDTALYFAELAKEKGKVFSFEFIKDNLFFFNRNLELNPEKKKIIELIEHPLWQKSGIEFSAFESGSGSRLSTQSSHVEKTTLYKTISIDDFVIKNSVEKINFIKLDIEGAELETLRGAAETIKKYKPRLAICLYHKNSDFWEIPRFLTDLVPDYEFYLDHFVTTPQYETVLFARNKNE